MALSRKRRRLLMLLGCLAGLGAGTAFTLVALNDNMVFFLAPSDIAAKAPSAGRTFRIGGLVAPGSLGQARQDGKPVARFVVTDGRATITVAYAGVLPDLFREGQGVVALGALRPDGSFLASEVLAKHDETYMPPEVAEALKKNGEWKPTVASAKLSPDWRPADARPAGTTDSRTTGPTDSRTTGTTDSRTTGTTDSRTTGTTR